MTSIPMVLNFSSPPLVLLLGTGRVPTKLGLGWFVPLLRCQGQDGPNDGNRDPVIRKAIAKDANATQCTPRRVCCENQQHHSYLPVVPEDTTQGYIASLVGVTSKWEPLPVVTFVLQHGTEHVLITELTQRMAPAPMVECAGGVMVYCPPISRCVPVEKRWHILVERVHHIHCPAVTLVNTRW